MTSIKLKFRASAAREREGSLYFQVIHERTVRQIATGCHIHESEWDECEGRVNIRADMPETRKHELDGIVRKIQSLHGRLCSLLLTFGYRAGGFTADDIVNAYNEDCSSQITVFSYFRHRIMQLQQVGRQRTSGTYQQALNSIVKYRNGLDLHFDEITQEFTLAYETWMRSQHLCRNTTSFYMRILRTLYNIAVTQQLTAERNPFRHVYTGIDKTIKRAVTLSEIRLIKNADLSYDSALDFSRDIFMLAFYLRGISPVDIAFLRKSDLCNGYISYCRRKTGQQMSIKWEKDMQRIIDKYPESATCYLLPIIRMEDGTEMQQYRNVMQKINRKLKIVSCDLHLSVPLTMYVARHSWASIAQTNRIPISVISGAMGHDSETTTKIYLTSIKTAQIDAANHTILKKL